MANKKKEVKDRVNLFSENEIKGNYIPVSEKDLASAINIPVKGVEIETVENMEKIGESKIVEKVIQKGEVKKKVKKKKRLASKKKFSKNNWKDRFKIPGVKNLKEKGPILIITEKPQAAEKIAYALANGSKVEKRIMKKVAYYDLQRDDKDMQIVCAVGHLFSLAQVAPRNKWPTFEIEWAPNYLVRKNDFTKKYYDVIASLCKKASEIVVATDYDVEGEVIGMNVVKYICNQKDAERMKFSTLTANEIQEAYENRSKNLDWNQGIAGETRHYLDWIYGINLSRALMNAVKSVGKFRLMSIGRVQGPALNVIVKKDYEIKEFISEKYWQVFLDVGNKEAIKVKHVKDILDEKDLDKFKELKGKEGDAKTEKTESKVPVPVPFDLTKLQTEVYRLYKITPSRTLQIAQKLYLAGVISYPRTSSQKIPKEIGYEKIIKRLGEKFKIVKFISREEPVEGKKNDPAHPSIYPTGEFQRLDEEEKKVYELIVKRFISCFCSEGILDNKKIKFEVDDLKFNAKGVNVREKGWMEVYPYKIEENEIPDLEGKVKVKNVEIEEKFTQPPKRYTPASIISLLEKKNLGTKATRSSIIETLYNRSYVKDRAITATSLGISLINSLEKNCKIIIDEDLTRDIEKKLDCIRSSKNPGNEMKKVIEETKKAINKIGKEFEKNKEKIGKDLVDATTKLWEQERKDAELMICDKCKKGKLAIKYNRRDKRYFVACNNYPECKTTYSLPPNGVIKKTGKECEECGWPMLMLLRKGRKPWIFCFNPECESKKKD